MKRLIVLTTLLLVSIAWFAIADTTVYNADNLYVPGGYVTGDTDINGDLDITGALIVEGTGDSSFVGPVTMTRKWISVATDTVLTAEQCKFTYIEVTAAATVTLPASESGLDIIVIQRTGGFQVYIDTNAANYIRNEDTDLDDGDKVGNDGVSSIKGDSYRLFSIPTGASTFDWQGLAIKGPWTDQGA